MTVSKPARKPQPRSAQSSLPPAQASAVQRMLDVSEELFAQEGLELVPLSRIMTLAGQKNRSALHYHFGSRGDLIARLLNRRLAHINDVRHQLLDQWEQGGRPDAAAGVLRACIRALTDTLADQPWGAHYVQVLAQFQMSPLHAVRRDLTDPANLSAIVRARNLVIGLHPVLSPALIDARFGWANDTVVYSLARMAREGLLPLDPAWVQELIEFCARGFDGAASGAPLPAIRSSTSLIRFF